MPTCNAANPFVRYEIGRAPAGPADAPCRAGVVPHGVGGRACRM
jgi:hypothetical protein